ncbi:MAG: hypothetical protein A2076_03365 [Geobacteraceae bacterium GWC2_53_11]|nr:MAG: hypothetical protein A2076_03365 [Geobacteraceae bacterium GWC2_53_11]
MFFFYFNRNNAAPPLNIGPQGIINRLMPCAAPDKSGFLADGDTSLLVQCLHWNTARSRLEPAPLYHAESRISAASWARLDNREELAKKLAIASKDLAGMCDTELILLSYLKWRETCVDHLIGDFVFVIHDRQRNTVFCGRDHMGVRPFYYFASGDLFVCATNVSALRQVHGVPFSIDERWVAEYMVHNSMSFDRTPYHNIKKLPPAHFLTVTPQQVQLQQYFTLSAEPALKLKDSREYVAAYREQLEEAIKCRLDSEYAIGSELSGGIDSSTITAFAAKLLDQPLSRLHCFGFAFAELEPQYILAVSKACRIPNTHIVANLQDHHMTTRRSLELLGYPMEHGNGPLHEPFYRLAERLDVRTMLSGFGGDEFGTTIHGYMVPMELLLQRRYRDLYRILPGNALFRFLRMVKLEWRRRTTANFTASSHASGFYEAYRQRWAHHIIRPELVRRCGIEERYFEEARFDAGYTDLKRFTLEKRWMPFVPTRMENCTLMAAGRKIDYRWPLLDVRLVRLFLAIPSEENFYRGMGRYLHRRAIAGVVPDLVAWKPGKDMGAIMGGQGARDFEHLRQVTIDDLHPSLAEHLDTDKLQQQIEQLPRILAAPLGDNKRGQYTRNIQAVKQLDTWLKTVSTDYTD